MHADTVVALIAAGLATIIAVVVPWMTFRLALRQDQTRWLRDQRAQLYVDLLTEAYAEQKYIEHAMATDKARALMGKHYVDLRLPPLERARLGARGTIFGSKATNRLLNRLQAEGLSAMLTPQPGDGDELIVRIRVGGILDELEAVIRGELGADRIPLEPGAAAAERDARRQETPGS